MSAALLLGTGIGRAARQRDKDVVVVASGIQRWRGTLKVGAAEALSCRVDRPAGDAARDDPACEAMRRCFATERPRILAAGKPGTTRPERRRRLAAARAELDRCFRSVSFRFAALPAQAAAGDAAPEPTGPARRR